MANLPKNGETAKIWKIYNKFHYNLDWRARFIINILGVSVFPIFIIFIFNLRANFSSLQSKFEYFLILFSFLVLFVQQKKTSISAISWDFDAQNNKICRFQRRKLGTQIKFNDYTNWKNAQIGKIFDNFT